MVCHGTVTFLLNPRMRNRRCPRRSRNEGDALTSLNPGWRVNTRIRQREEVRVNGIEKHPTFGAWGIWIPASPTVPLPFDETCPASLSPRFSGRRISSPVSWRALGESNAIRSRGFDHGDVDSYRHLVKRFRRFPQTREVIYLGHAKVFSIRSTSL